MKRYPPLWLCEEKRESQANGVVVDFPGFDTAPGSGKIDKRVLVRTRIVELAVESRYPCVLNRLPVRAGGCPTPGGLRACAA